MFTAYVCGSTFYPIAHAHQEYLVQGFSTVGPWPPWGATRLSPGGHSQSKKHDHHNGHGHYSGCASIYGPTKRNKTNFTFPIQARGATGDEGVDRGATDQKRLRNTVLGNRKPLKVRDILGSNPGRWKKNWNL